MKDGMTDDVFLSYCSLHATTDRALFHADHVQRLHDLAGTHIPELTKDFYTLRSNYVDPLVYKARARMEQPT